MQIVELIDKNNMFMAEYKTGKLSIDGSKTKSGKNYGIRLRIFVDI